MQTEGHQNDGKLDAITSQICQHSFSEEQSPMEEELNESAQHKNNDDCLVKMEEETIEDIRAIPNITGSSASEVAVFQPNEVLQDKVATKNQDDKVEEEVKQKFNETEHHPNEIIANNPTTHDSNGPIKKETGVDRNLPTESDGIVEPQQDQTSNEVVKTEQETNEDRKEFPVVKEEKEKREEDVMIEEQTKKEKGKKKIIKSPTPENISSKKSSKAAKTPFKRNLEFYSNKFDGVPAREYSLFKSKPKKQSKEKTETSTYKTKDKWGADDFFNSLMDVPQDQRFSVMESRHDYVQWVFPNFVESMFNWNSYPLTVEEADTFRKSPEITIRFIRFYRLFINFLGGDIVDLSTGEIAPLEDEKVRKERFKNLNYSGHNYLRITRIFNSLHAFGLQPYMTSLFTFFENNFKHFKNCKHSLETFWAKAKEGDRKVNNEPSTLVYCDNTLLKEILIVMNAKEKKSTDGVMKELSEKYKCLKDNN